MLTTSHPVVSLSMLNDCLPVSVVCSVNYRGLFICMCVCVSVEAYITLHHKEYDSRIQ